MSVYFEVSRVDASTLRRIMRRLRTMHKIRRDVKEEDFYKQRHMDLAAVVCTEGLDLKKLLESNDFDFTHDVYGIMLHLDRDTGKLQNHFIPRCNR